MHSMVRMAGAAICNERGAGVTVWLPNLVVEILDIVFNDRMMTLEEVDYVTIDQIQGDTLIVIRMMSGTEVRWSAYAAFLCLVIPPGNKKIKRRVPEQTFERLREPFRKIPRLMNPEVSGRYEFYSL